MFTGSLFSSVRSNNLLLRLIRILVPGTFPLNLCISKDIIFVLTPSISMRSDAGEGILIDEISLNKNVGDRLSVAANCSFRRAV